MTQSILAFGILGAIILWLLWIYISVWMHPESWVKKPLRRKRKKKK